VVADEMSGTVTVYDRHLDVHEDDIGFGVGWFGGVGCGEVVKSFFAIPDCGNFEAEFTNGFEGYLLVYGTSVVRQASGIRMGDLLVFDQQDLDFSPLF
jgi:hypothetical protein